MIGYFIRSHPHGELLRADYIQVLYINSPPQPHEDYKSYQLVAHSAYYSTVLFQHAKRKEVEAVENALLDLLSALSVSDTGGDVFKLKRLPRGNYEFVRER